jgi:hypothetical protein
MMSYHQPDCQNSSNGPRLALDPAYYRPISLLSVMYKLLERLIIQRIQLLIVAASLAGLRKHCSCTEEVMALTIHIAAGFQRQLKTGVVFVDLSAGYDIV